MMKLLKSKYMKLILVIGFITVFMAPVLSVAARADTISDYTVNLYDHAYQDYNYKCGKSSHTHTSACVHSWSYVSSYSRNCGREEHTHTDSCYRTNSVTYATTTANCSGCSGTPGYTTKVGHSAWSCDVCGANQSSVGVCWTHTFSCQVGSNGMTYTYGTATHTCKTLTCSREEHTHTGNSSSGGGCYGKANYSSGSDDSNCPYGYEHSHTSSCRSYYTAHTYHADKEPKYGSSDRTRSR